LRGPCFFLIRVGTVWAHQRGVYGRWGYEARPSKGRRESNDFVSLEEVERRAIVQTLRETRSDKLAAARLWGIGKTTLYRKLKQAAILARPSDPNDRRIVDEKEVE